MLPNLTSWCTEKCAGNRLKPDSFLMLHKAKYELLCSISRSLTRKDEQRLILGEPDTENDHRS
jgi:hypothetical protein